MAAFILMVERKTGEAETRPHARRLLQSMARDWPLWSLDLSTVAAAITTLFWRPSGSRGRRGGGTVRRGIGKTWYVGNICSPRPAAGLRRNFLV
jgi:hypothetical protein